MSNPDEITVLRVHPRPSEPVTLSIPIDTLGTIREVAETRDMSPEALMKLYIGHGLRQDTARLFSERIFDMTERVLARHIPSEAERSAILREIRGEVAGLAGEHLIRRPNATTRRALEDAEARRRLTSFASPDELFEDLGK